jgi:hypothetical protein
VDYIGGVFMKKFAIIISLLAIAAFLAVTVIFVSNFVSKLSSLPPKHDITEQDKLNDGYTAVSRLSSDDMYNAAFIDTNDKQRNIYILPDKHPEITPLVKNLVKSIKVKGLCDDRGTDLNGQRIDMLWENTVIHILLNAAEPEKNIIIHSRYWYTAQADKEAVKSIIQYMNEHQ